MMKDVFARDAEIHAICFASLLYEFALRVCFAALSLLLNYNDTNHFYILSSKNRTYRNIVMKLRFDITFRLYKRNNILITYTYYHSDSKATPCGFSNVSRSEVALSHILRDIDIFFIKLYNLL